ncbi:MAG TPA: hypothetical protein VFR73_20535, partial [Hyphomicrobiaceae bacterium]|nr:hypothetical protein [Hyphomicrobiaceae bacterium]
MIEIEKVAARRAATPANVPLFTLVPIRLAASSCPGYYIHDYYCQGQGLAPVSDEPVYQLSFAQRIMVLVTVMLGNTIYAASVL